MSGSRSEGRPILTGLSSADVAGRTAAGRSNRYRPRTSRSLAGILRANVLTLFNAIIGGCFAVLLVIGDWQDALFGLSAVANLVIGTWQEVRAKVTLDRLALPAASSVRAVRDGREVALDADDVVIDDLLVLRVGDRVAADARVVVSDGLQADESLLTGESDAVDKRSGDALLGGSIIVGGEGRALVERVGAETFANGLAAQARRFSLVSSELHAGVQTVLRWVAWAIGPLALLVFTAQVVALGGWSDVFRGEGWRDATVYTIAAVVAMIPLGLVLMTSIAFAVGGVRLARRHVLVQELAAVEVLARVDVICFDKTGTLTEGDVRQDEEVLLLPPSQLPHGWRDALGWFGSAADANATARALGERYPAPPGAVPTGRIPFSSARKWSGVSFSGDSAPGTWILGAADVLFPDHRLDETVRSATARGRRVLVLAHADVALVGDAGVPPGIRPAVVVTFRERVREDAAQTLAFFAREGVAIRVLSGDDPRTVAAIAAEVGLGGGDDFDARDLPDDPHRLVQAVDEHVVIGRVTPDRKRDIVAALQAAGRTVAVTGDGANDIPALKRADIGIAMSSGTDATKAIARMVLLDGRFAELPTAVAEGRRVMANIERISMLFLTKTVYAAVLAAVFGAFLLAFPFLPRQLSVIDGLTIGLPAFFLALLPNLRPYERGFLRRSLGFAVPVGCIVGLTVFAYSWAATAAGLQEEELRTGSTLLLGAVALWVLAVVSRPFDLRKLAVLAAMVTGLAAVFTLPLIRRFLVLVDLSAPAWALVAGFSIVAIVLIESVVSWSGRRRAAAGAGARAR